MYVCININTQIIVCIHKYNHSFLFEVIRISSNGDILKKLYASHHASEADSTHISHPPSHLFQILVCHTIHCEGK